jgi:hypothetical protein
MLSRGNPLSEKPVDAIVSNRSRHFIRIVLAETPTDLRRDTWRMDRGANRIAHDRMRDARPPQKPSSGHHASYRELSCWPPCPSSKCPCAGQSGSLRGQCG